LLLLLHQCPESAPEHQLLLWVQGRPQNKTPDIALWDLLLLLLLLLQQRGYQQQEQ
jgi:hypothetical protein